MSTLGAGILWFLVGWTLGILAGWCFRVALTRAQVDLRRYMWVDWGAGPSRTATLDRKRDGSLPARGE